MELTSRELASIIVLVVFVAVAVLLAPRHGGIGRSVGAFMKALLAPKILVVVAAYLSYAASIVAVPYYFGLWSWDLLKDTLIAVLFVGFPIVANASKFKDGIDVLGRVITEVLGLSALLVLYLNLAPLPLWGELIVQPVLLVLTLMSAIASRDPKLAPVVKPVNNIIVVIATWLLIRVAVQVTTALNTFDWADQARAFSLSVWIPLAVIPFVYTLGYVAACEMALVRLKFSNGRQKPPLRVRLALLLGFRGSLRYARGFSGSSQSGV